MIPVDGAVVTRLSRMADAERVLDAHAEVGYPARLFTQALLDDTELSIRVIWSASGKFIALGKAAFVDSATYITDIMVMPAERNRGYGKLLMTVLHDDARARGCTWTVLTSTAMGKSLYEQLGYRVVGEQTLYCTPDHA
jgi:ribosomal protein S18 acetylase RimI-like enzyme